MFMNSECSICLGKSLFRCGECDLEDEEVVDIPNGYSSASEDDEVEA